MLRVIARALILWNTLNPTFLWVESQLPASLIKAVQQRSCPKDVHVHTCTMRLASSDMEAVRHVHSNIIAGACFSLGLRYAGTSCRTAQLSVLHYLGHFAILCSTGFENVETMEGNSRNHSSALFSTNGSGPRQGRIRQSDEKLMARAAFLASAVTEHARQFAELLHDVHRNCHHSAAIPTSEAVAFVLCPDRPVLESCISATAIGLAMLMAGTGDLESLLVLLEFRRMDTSSTYGFHMAINMSIGLLFLGAGRASLSRNNQSISALMAAFFPKFPVDAEDNRYHLQPLRHLWSLAVAWRGLEVIDADSGDVMSLPVTISLRRTVDWRSEMTSKLTLTAPCLLPPLEDVLLIAVDSSRYVMLSQEVNTCRSRYIQSGAFASTYFASKRSCNPGVTTDLGSSTGVWQRY
mmetsp:Transcript_19899/g.64068  ORF Transcript_19899/g.64068 Transcript_19899/m.64068 type:complete len:408 (-) Transcript_19899:1145-2368(-)